MSATETKTADLRVANVAGQNAPPLPFRIPKLRPSHSWATKPGSMNANSRWTDSSHLAPDDANRHTDPRQDRAGDPHASHTNESIRDRRGSAENIKNIEDFALAR
jgi:hypothetical protein